MTARVADHLEGPTPDGPCPLCGPSHDDYTHSLRYPWPDACPKCGGAPHDAYDCEAP